MKERPNLFEPSGFVVVGRQLLGRAGCCVNQNIQQLSNFDECLPCSELTRLKPYFEAETMLNRPAFFGGANSREYGAIASTARLKSLEGEHQALWQANENLRTASACFVQAELGYRFNLLRKLQA